MGFRSGFGEEPWGLGGEGEEGEEGQLLERGGDRPGRMRSTDEGRGVEESGKVNEYWSMGAFPQAKNVHRQGKT